MDALKIEHPLDLFVVVAFSLSWRASIAWLLRSTRVSVAFWSALARARVEAPTRLRIAVSEIYMTAKLAGIIQ